MFTCAKILIANKYLAETQRRRIEHRNAIKRHDLRSLPVYLQQLVHV
jgi:hypothetical protein